jgi:hypothetical protein
MRLCAIFCLVFLVFTTADPCFCQTVAGCYPQCVPPVQPCPVSRPAPPPPITRTVQVDVPLPCAPAPCGPPMACPPQACAPPMCPLPCPTRPVQVKIDVRVRPEPCGQQRPDQDICRDYGALAPLIGVTAAIMSAPIRLLERMFPGPCLRRPPQSPCGPYGAPPHWGFPPAPPAGFVPGCPMPSCAPVPLCEPPMPVPAYQKCVPRPACGAVMQPACPPYPPGPYAVGGMGR